MGKGQQILLKPHPAASQEARGAGRRAMAHMWKGMRHAMRPTLPSCTEFSEENRTNAVLNKDMRLGPTTEHEDGVKNNRHRG